MCLRLCLRGCKYRCVCTWFLVKGTEFGVHFNNTLVISASSLFHKGFRSDLTHSLSASGAVTRVNCPSTGAVRGRVKESHRTKYVDIKPFTRAPIVVKFKAQKSRKFGLQLLRCWRKPLGAKPSYIDPLRLPLSFKAIGCFFVTRGQA